VAHGLPSMMLNLYSSGYSAGQGSIGSCSSNRLPVLREKAEGLMLSRPVGEARKNRYELVKSRSMQVQEDGLFVPIDGQSVSLQDHRFGRIQYLLGHVVDPGVLRAVVMERVGRKPDAMEALGLLTAMKLIAETADTVS
jgi:hypothetical protein